MTEKRDGLTPQTVQPTPESVARYENYAEVKRLEREEHDAADWCDINGGGVVTPDQVEEMERRKRDTP